MAELWSNLGGTLERLEFAEASAVASVTGTGVLCTRLLPHARSVLPGLGWKLDDADLSWQVARNPEANVVLKHVRLDPDLYGGTSPKKYCIYSFTRGLVNALRLIL